MNIPLRDLFDVATGCTELDSLKKGGEMNIICEQCKREVECDPSEGLPDYWAALPLARYMESVDYTAPNGGLYTLQDIGGDAEDRPHVYICPPCTKDLWPWTYN